MPDYTSPYRPTQSRAQSFLPICAGLACREGLPYDEALKAIAINPAQIIGVGDRVGSLEKGKDADIRILSSDHSS